MKLTNKKLSSLWVGIILAFYSFYTYAEESHRAQAIKHT